MLLELVFIKFFLLEIISSNIFCIALFHILIFLLGQTYIWIHSITANIINFMINSCILEMYYILSDLKVLNNKNLKKKQSFKS